MADDRQWKRRFFLFMGMRLVGLAIFFLGLVIAFTGLLRPGGWPVAGSIAMILGLAVAVIAPRLLSKKWRAEDRDGE